MGYLGGSTFRFLRRQEQWRGNGSREIETQPERPDRSAADEKWLAANFKPPINNRGSHEGTRQHKS